MALREKNLRNSKNASSLRANLSSIITNTKPVKVLPIINKLTLKQQIAVKESIQSTVEGSSARNTNDSKWHFTNNQKYGSHLAHPINHQTSSKSQLKDLHPLKNLIVSKERVGMTVGDEYTDFHLIKSN